MAKFVVVSVKDLAGVAKGSGRPYSMRIMSGVFTDDLGVSEVGETSFMQRGDQPLPTVVPGQAYTPTIGITSRDGKLALQITELKPIVASAASRAA